MTFNKEKFQQLRESRGLTLDDVAIACNVSKQTVQKWEKHSFLKPRPAKIPMLAKLLHCEESDLVQYGSTTLPDSDSLKIDDLMKAADLLESIDSTLTQYEGPATAPRDYLLKTAKVLRATASKLAEVRP